MFLILILRGFCLFFIYIFNSTSKGDNYMV